MMSRKVLATSAPDFDSIERRAADEAVSRTFSSWKFRLLDALAVDVRLQPFDFRVSYLLLQYMNSNPVCAVVNPFVPSCCNKKEISIQVQQAGSATNVNMGTNNLLHVEYDLTVTPFPIQEVRVSIVDLNLYYKPDNACVQCYTSYNYLGVFDLTAVQPTLGSLANISQFPTDMDLIYSGIPTLVSTAQTLGLNIKLPVLESIPCCYVEGEVCLKFTFKDANCNYCERVVCLPVTY